ncbi:unnamed protein product [Closterium sp. Yama58-4]|nr:unnamed protein product [Closterium sp. Yama58-4]
MLVPLDSYHGHQHTMLAVGVWDGNRERPCESLAHPVPAPCPLCLPPSHARHLFLSAMLFPVDSYHGHQHTILAVGVDGSRRGRQQHTTIHPSFLVCVSLFLLPAMLVPVDSYHGHQHTILAVGVDNNSGATWSAAMDGSLIMWGGDGKPRQSLLLGSHYVCGMDLLYSPPSLLLAAAPRVSVC